MNRTHGFAPFFSVAVIVLAGCAAAPGTDVANDEIESVDTAEEAVSSLFVLDVTKPNAKAGLTLIRTNAEYRRFFDCNAPRSVNFGRHAVLHYSTDVFAEGGYEAKITGVDRRIDRKRETLTVITYDAGPGLYCPKVEGPSNPQMTVRIAKPLNRVTVEEQHMAGYNQCEPPAEEVCPSPNLFCELICKGEPAFEFPPHCPQPMCACALPEPIPAPIAEGTPVAEPTPQ